MSPTTVGIICIILMLFLLLTGMNIGFLFLFIGFLGYVMLSGLNSGLGLLRSSVYMTAGNYNYSVVPLFILMGQFAFHSGLTGSLYDAASKWLGRLPGGLADATIVACAAFGAICGSIAATTATMGNVAIPEMRKHGYADKLTTGCVASGGTLGILIPPSTPFIVYGICTQLSIGELFAAGVIPGIIMALCFIAVVTIMVLHDPSIAPKTEKFTLRQKLASLKGIIGIVILFLAVFVGMFGGFFTVNEAAAIGAFLAFVFMIINRRMTWKRFLQVMKESLLSTAMVYAILIGASVMTTFLAATGLPATIAEKVVASNMPTTLLLVLITVVYLIMGCFIDSISMILLTVPIFFPIVLALDINPIWFGVLCIIVGQVGAITPPVGICCYIIGGIAKDVPLNQVFRSIVPFLFGMIATIVIIFIIPESCTWLPNLIYG